MGIVASTMQTMRQQAWKRWRKPRGSLLRYTDDSGGDDEWMMMMMMVMMVMIMMIVKADDDGDGDGDDY
jgi:hypothetical protein